MRTKTKPRSNINLWMGRFELLHAIRKNTVVLSLSKHGSKGSATLTTALRQAQGYGMVSRSLRYPSAKWPRLTKVVTTPVATISTPP